VGIQQWVEEAEQIRNILIQNRWHLARCP